MQKGLRLDTSGIAFDPEILQDRDPWGRRPDRRPKHCRLNSVPPACQSHHREGGLNGREFALPWHKTGQRRNFQSEDSMLISEVSRERQRYCAPLLLILALRLILAVPARAQEAGGTTLGAGEDPTGPA